MNFNSVGQMDYLVYSDLKEMQVVNSICYVVSVSKEVSRVDTNYYRLLVRTVDGKVMACTILDVNDFDKLGFRLNSLVNKYIRLEAVVRLGNGRFYLGFIGLSLVEQVTPELVMRFQKSIDGIDEYYSDINNIYSSIFGKPFPVILKNKYYPNIYNGYAGGFIKLTWEMMIQCQSMFQGTDYDNVLEVMFSSLINYSSFLNRSLELNLVTDSDRIEFVSNIPNNDFNGRLIRETTASLIGLSKPNHIIPVLINKAFNDLFIINNLKSSWDLMMFGGVSQCQGIDLVKY